MSAERPLWRQMFDAAERAVGEPLEERLVSREFLAVISTVTKTQRAATRAIEGVMAANLHMLGLPALEDIRDLSKSVTRLERRVRDLQEQLEDLGEASERTRE